MGRQQQGAKVATVTVISITHRIDTLHIIEYENGRFGYVGKVPISIAFVDATPEQLRAMKFGGRFGPKTRIFPTYRDASEYAQKHGYEITQ